MITISDKGPWRRIERIGDAVLLLGDCLEILPVLPKVDLFLADPPYEISAAGGGIGGRRQYLTDIRGHIDGGFDEAMLSAFDNWMVFCGKLGIIRLCQQAEQQGLRWQLRTWNKTNPTPLTNGNYLPDTEYMVHAFKTHKWKGKKRWVVGRVEQNNIDHPTVKPQYVMCDALECSSSVGNTVLDAYMGTASTGVACANLGRSFIGIEIEEKYFNIAAERIENAYRQKPMFPGDGYDEVNRSYEQLKML